MEHCPNCGNEFDSPYCPNCGAKVPDDDPEEPLETEEPFKSEGLLSTEDDPAQDEPAGPEPTDGAVEPTDAVATEVMPMTDSPTDEEPSDGTSQGDDKPTSESPIEQDHPLEPTEVFTKSEMSLPVEEADVAATEEPGDLDNHPEANSSFMQRLKSDRKTQLMTVGIAVLLVVMMLFGTHVICFHNWEDATCTEPMTCSICKRTQDEPLGHSWKDATCTEAQTCTRCGETTGRANGHDWTAATCTEPQTCKVCGQKQGVPLGHDAEPTCTEDAVCSRCGETVPSLGHAYTDATCTEPATCTRCGSTDGEPLGHTTDSGVCSRCGEEIYATNSGSGDSVISDIETGDFLYRIHITNSGRSNFAVWAHDATGDRDLLVNTIGNYDGYTFLYGESPYTLEIKSSGNWSYTVEKLTATDETSFSGTGDYVTNIFNTKSGAWRFTHDGSHNFAVWVITGNGRDLLVNTIGSYDGTNYVSASSSGNALFIVEADGNWSITPA